jgi:peptidoglycan hydrolase-like protein with peptidoglycan-binding domain
MIELQDKNNILRYIYIMKKKTLLILILVVAIVIPVISFAAPDGFTVIKEGDINLNGIMAQYRLRDLGYLCYRPTGKFGPLSVDAVKRFQNNNGLQKDGQIGPTTFDLLFDSGLSRSGLKTDVIMYGNSEENISNTGDAIAWDSIDVVFKKGSTATIYDTKSPAKFTVKRVGGLGHAHVEPLTTKDTDGFFDMFTKTKEQLEYIKNGRLTYEKRPCVLEIGEKRYAASMFGYVHGDEPQFVPNPDNPDETIEANNMKGYLCLYFAGSTSDVFNMKDYEHDRAVEIAAQQ